VTKSLPPYPHSDLQAWARQLVEYLSSKERVEQEQPPAAVQLLHQKGEDKALFDGVVMYAPDRGFPVYSLNGEWSHFVDNSRMRWLGAWQQGAPYYLNDVVRDGNWTMIANKLTTDRPGPQPFGPPTIGFPPDAAFLIAEHTGLVSVAHIFDVKQDGAPTLVQIWVPEVGPNISHRVTVTDLGTGAVLQDTPIFPPAANEWFQVTVDGSLIPAGVNIEFRLTHQNDAGEIVETANYNKAGTSQKPATDPGLGNYGFDNQGNILRVNKTGNGGGDANPLLDRVIPGTVFNFAAKADPTAIEEFFVTRVQGDYANHKAFGGNYSGSNVSVGTDTATTVTHPIPAPTKYVYYANGWASFSPPWANVTSDRDLGNISAPQPADTYGIFVIHQQYVISDDWEVVAGPATILPAPVTGDVT